MKIALLNTGGTISCSGSPLTPMSATAFASACQNALQPRLQQRFPALEISHDVDLIFPASATGSLDSANIQPSDWCLIAAHILNHYDDYDAWVILHGTDSLAYTASALPLLLSSFNTLGQCTAALSKPVVLTGSQRPLFEATGAQAGLGLDTHSDAYQNLCGALASAQSGIAEVGVFFHQQLLRGNRALKVHTTADAAFASPNHPALARYDGQLHLDHPLALPAPAASISLSNPAVRASAIERLAHIARHIDHCPVTLFPAFPAAYSHESASALIADLINACVARGIKGLVLASYGSGNFPSGNPNHPTQGAIYGALKAATDGGVIIINCTQVAQGRLAAHTYAAGAWLSEAGVVSGADMTLMAAVSKLTVLLAWAEHQRWPAATLKALMQADLTGELSPDASEAAGAA